VARYLTTVEEIRERAARTLRCPVCDAAPGHACEGPRKNTGHRNPLTVAHTGRYNAAVKAGLVPALPGGGP
jgi:hypothetical protein